MSDIQNPLYGTFVLTIFGATGDLAQNKLFPALFSLFQKKQIGNQFYIVGFSRRDFSDEDFRNYLAEVMTKNGKIKDKKQWEQFVRHIYYQAGNFNEETGYKELIPKLKAFDDEIGACITRVFYLATPPDHYLPILTFLDSTELAEGCGQGSSKWTRIAIEKPFGKDVETAQMLDKKLAEIFEEKQIFRVDHYLEKETVQNLLAFRFANSVFEPIWKNEYIDHVQITWMEKEGVGRRGKFFDGVGILRDVGQNHLMQLLSAIVMEQPRSFEKEAIRDVRAAAIKSLICIEPKNVLENTVRGQYKSYTQEKDVDPHSKTETYVAMKLFLDSPRFKYVPFYLRAAKKMPKEMMEISVVFKQTCHILFKEYGCPEVGNVITFRIQPDEGIRIQVIAKTPGSKLSLETIDMKFAYKEHIEHRISDAYEKVLMDIFSGDQMLFNRSDELFSSWEFITKILDGWKDAAVPLYLYKDGSKGPKEADELIEKDGRKWI
ncbi:MAG TPA: glucose-6-phosphate dehydrogenase [Patescibacteria group bacterium]|nr:glucose-6-phosphate dehydrogenase [Patescibacteria group bacterium]